MFLILNYCYVRRYGMARGKNKKKRCEDEKPTIQQYVYLPRRLDKKIMEDIVRVEWMSNKKGKKAIDSERKREMEGTLAIDIFKLTIINVDIFSLSIICYIDFFTLQKTINNRINLELCKEIPFPIPTILTRYC